MSLSWKTRRYDICRHLGCWKVGGMNSVMLAGISDKLVSYPYVLCALVEVWVLCKLNSAFISKKMES